MKNVVFIAGVIAAATSLTAVAAWAQGPGSERHGERMSFQELDTDGNGEISQAEMEQRGAAKFAAADTDGDGMLSEAEIITSAQKRAEERAAMMITEFDANGDGALSMDEMPKPRKFGRMFDRVDKDKSGGISEEEFAAAQEKMQRHSKKHKKSGSDKN